MAGVKFETGTDGAVFTLPDGRSGVIIGGYSSRAGRTRVYAGFNNDTKHPFDSIAAAKRWVNKQARTPRKSNPAYTVTGYRHDPEGLFGESFEVIADTSYFNKALEAKSRAEKAGFRKLKFDTLYGINGTEEFYDYGKGHLRGVNPLMSDKRYSDASALAKGEPRENPRMTPAEAREILGDRPEWELVNMRKARGFLAALNTPEDDRVLEAIGTALAEIRKRKRGKNPVPEGNTSRVAKAKRRYSAFRGQPVTGTYEVKAPNYTKGAKYVGKVSAIDYTTFRGKDNNTEKYRHKFAVKCAPALNVSGVGDYWSAGGHFRFTARGFVDSKPSKLGATKATRPPFPVAVVVGYLDAIRLSTGKKLVLTNKKVLLCVSESGYNFFTVKEP